MARRGRRPKPTVLRELQGTFHATRHGRDRANEPEVPGDKLGDPPDYLSPGQQDAWNYAIRWAPAGLLKPIDRSVLMIWCEAQDTYRRAVAAQRILDTAQPRAPLLVATKAGLVVSPYVKIMRRSAALMHAAARELGFLPSSPQRLSAGTEAKGPAPGSVWAQVVLLQGGRSSTRQ